jgi:hypothetical protein
VRIFGSNRNDIDAISIYNVRGQLVAEYSQYLENSIQLPNQSGVYLIGISVGNEEKVIRVFRD